MSAVAEERRPGVSRTMKRGDTFTILGVEIRLLDVQGNKARLSVQTHDGTTVDLFPQGEQPAKI